jgi:hypothetical protein
MNKNDNKVVMFFWLLLLEEKATIRAAALCKKLIANKFSELEACLEAMRLLKLKNKNPHASFEVAQKNCPAHWVNFYQKATFEEIFAVLAIEIMGFDHTKISTISSVTEGTLKSRLHRGLRRLGLSR